jgi:hypothetical protein
VNNFKPKEAQNMASVASPAPRTQRAVLVILAAWLLAGTLDIATAILYYLRTSR